MAQIQNLNGITHDELAHELANGAKFVVFEYCISILIMTFKRPTDVYFIRAGESTIKHSIGPTILTFIMGWWGIPWGPIYSIMALYNNVSGGKDMTNEVRHSLGV